VLTTVVSLGVFEKKSRNQKKYIYILLICNLKPLFVKQRKWKQFLHHPNTWATINFSSHWYPAVPWFWIYLHINGSERSHELVINYWVAVCVTIEELQRNRLKNFRNHEIIHCQRACCTIVAKGSKWVTNTHWQCKMYLNGSSNTPHICVIDKVQDVECKRSFLGYNLGSPLRLTIFLFDPYQIFPRNI